MVLIDSIYSMKARMEMAEVEKQLLSNLKNNNPIKNAATSVPPYMCKEAPAYQQFKPEDMHCLKSLLEQEYPLKAGAVGCLLHDSSAKCKCISEFFAEGLDYVQEEYLKYLKQKKEDQLQQYAEGYGKPDDYIESEEESDSDMGSSSSSSSSDDDDDEENAVADGSGLYDINLH